LEQNLLTDTTHISPPSLTARRLLGWFVALLALSAATALACSLVGQIRLAPGWRWRVWDMPLWSDAIWRLRMMRLLTAATVGSALAVAGLALQGLLRNPLAEPYILGISSGAGVGVLLGPALAAAVGLADWAATPVLAMIGALLTAGAVYGIAQRRGRLDPYVLLLAGVIVNLFNGAVILTVLQFVRQEEMFRFIGWGMGQIPEYLGVEPALPIVCAVLALLGWAAVFLRSASLNVLGLGDEVAASHGVPVHRLRIETFVVVALMTSAAVALAGPVGFVGVIVPHVCRLTLGPDHRRLAVVCGFCGAIFLMAADTLCRVIGGAFSLGELPVGVVTALCGGPFFILLLRRRAREGLG
jgi:iron complex transport system permease protein